MVRDGEPGSTRGGSIERILPLLVGLAGTTLFFVELEAGQRLLPRLGGGPVVWASTVVLFQVLLVAAYLFGAAIARWGTRPLALFVLAGAAIGFSRDGATTGPLGMQVFAGIGPGLLLIAFGAAGTLPVLLHRLGPDQPSLVRRLVAMSNAGSFLGLGLGALLLQSMDASLRGTALRVVAIVLGGLALLASGSRSNAEKADSTAVSTQLWLGAASAIGVFWYVSVHSRMEATTLVSPVMWAVTLGLYLASWIAAFAVPPSRRIAMAATLATLLGVGFALGGVLDATFGDLSVARSLVFSAAAIGSGCLGIHLVARRAYLSFASATHASVITALGGALGGMAALLAAPLVLTTQQQLAVAVAIGVAVLAQSRASKRLVPFALVALSLSVLTLLIPSRAGRTGDVLRTERTWASEYHIVLYDATSELDRHRVLYSSGTVHGAQYLHPSFLDLPTAYFATFSGAGRAMRAVGQKLGREYPARIGVVGLGTGALAAYADANDFVRFFELDAGVEELARPATGEVGFSFLDLTPARVEVKIGDGRRLLAEEHAVGEAPYDILVVDAFTGGNVPAHLLTREAFELYASRVDRRGIVALHTSNHVLDLRPAVYAGAESVGARAALVRNRSRASRDPASGTSHISMLSDWILLWWDDATGQALQQQLAELLSTGEIVVQDAATVDFEVRGLLTDERFGIWHLRQGRVGERLVTPR